MISTNLKIKVRKLLRKLLHNFVDTAAHCIQTFVRLLDNCKSYNTFATSHRQSLLLNSRGFDTADILQLNNPFARFDIDIFYIVFASKNCSHLDGIFIDSVFYAHTSRITVVALESVGNILNFKTINSHFVHIWRYHNALRRNSRNICHSHLGKLLHTSADDVFYRLTHLQKLRLVAIIVFK